jgi:hypothetical protein
LPPELFRQAIWDSIVQTNNWNNHHRLKTSMTLLCQISNKKVMEYHSIISSLEDKINNYEVSFYLNETGLIVEYK